MSEEAGKSLKIIWNSIDISEYVKGISVDLVSDQQPMVGYLTGPVITLPEMVSKVIISATLPGPYRTPGVTTPIAILLDLVRQYSTDAGWFGYNPHRKSLLDDFTAFIQLPMQGGGLPLECLRLIDRYVQAGASGGETPDGFAKWLKELPEAK